MIPKLLVSLLTFDFLRSNSEEKLFMYQKIRNVKQVVSLLGFQAEGKYGLKNIKPVFQLQIAAYYKIKVND